MKKFLVLVFLILGIGLTYGISSSETPSASEELGLLSGSPALCVDINNATFDELQSITHIGIDEAISIMNFRRAVDFRFVDDLNYIRGINPNELAEIKAEGLACVPSLNL